TDVPSKDRDSLAQSTAETNDDCGKKNGEVRYEQQRKKTPETLEANQAMKRNINNNDTHLMMAIWRKTDDFNNVGSNCDKIKLLIVI
ncbi:2379_t:CDS:2, partial [Scutellospora calospora]